MDGIAFEAPPPIILVVEDDPIIGRMLRATLEAEGFTAIVAQTGEDGIAYALREVPQLLILDIMLPGIDGFAVVKQLRNNVKTAHIPVMMLSARHDTADKIRAFDIEVDDYLTKPFNSSELLARIRTQLRHVRDNLLSPLTGLPSGLRVERAIEQQLESSAPWSILYLDLDHFKAYNDVYGFIHGNDLIRLLAHVTVESVRAYGNPGDFVGHIGGDDFVIITSPERVDPVCRELIDCWSCESKSLYSPEDLARDGLVATDRQGRMQSFGLVTVSIGIVTNQRRPISSLEEVSRVAAEVKSKAKSLAGNSYYVDRRSVSERVAHS